MRHQAVVEAAKAWAARDERVRALLLKGSLARGEADERSDVDLVVISRPGRLAELWDDRDAVAASLGPWLGGFDEVAWQAPHTFIGFYDGPLKVDFFFQDGEPLPDPWLLDGYQALHDPEGLAERLRPDDAAPDLADSDVHAFDWLWAADVKLRRGGNEWLVYIELVKFVETMLIGGHNALTSEPWRGVDKLDDRLPPATTNQLRAALPRAPEPGELQRAFHTSLDAYLELRQRLAAELNMPLADELARQVLMVLGGTPPSTPP